MLQLDAYWRGVLEVVGRPDLIDDPRFADGAFHQHHADLVAELEAVFASRTLAEWRGEFAQPPAHRAVVPPLLQIRHAPTYRTPRHLPPPALPTRPHPTPTPPPLDTSVRLEDGSVSA